jgi:hypothetical protein
VNPNIINIKRIPGKLCFNPTDLSLAYPHGGTGLGVVNSVSVKPYASYYPIKAEEFGLETVDYIFGGESWVLGAILRSFDADAIDKLFMGGSKANAGALIQNPIGDTQRAGILMSAANSIKLLFSPDDTIRQPFVIFYNAVPLIDETAEMNFELELDWSVGVLFAGIRDADNRIVAAGLKGDFVL